MPESPQPQVAVATAMDSQQLAFRIVDPHFILRTETENDVE